MGKLGKRQKQAKLLRVFRKVHRITGAFLFLFFFIIGISGILLGWKSNSNGMILPTSQQGSSTELAHWLPIDELHKKAIHILKDSVNANLAADLDRIDVRKDKGMVKFVFEKHLWEIQLDGATGELLQIGRRNSDFIENIHDGTIIDELTNNSLNLFKLFYTSIMGLALLLFTITGFWLWYGPKRMKRKRRFG